MLPDCAWITGYSEVGDWEQIVGVTPTPVKLSGSRVVFPEREFLGRTGRRRRVAELPPVDRALVRNQAQPDQGVGLRAGAPAPLTPG